MKVAKKILALVLVTMLMVSMAATAFADEQTYTITINNSTSGYEYEAYQIFKGDLSDGKLSNIDWGTGVDANKVSELLSALKEASVGDSKPFGTCDSARSVAEVLATDSAKDNAVAQKFAEVVSGFLSTTKATSTYADSKYTITGLSAGYYLVKNTTVPGATDTTGSGSYTRYILEVVGDVSVSHKGTVPEVEKKISENNQLVDKNEASIGDTVTYQITGSLPRNIADYHRYYYEFTDTLSKGLTLTDTDASKEGVQTDIKVEIVNGDDEKDVTNSFTISTTDYSAENGTTITIKIDNLLSLENVTINSSTKVVVTYTAKVNENAIVGDKGNKNDVKLTYSNNPNYTGNGGTDEPHGETPKDEVYTYTTELTIIKKDDKGNILTGAAFKIEGEGVNVVIVTREVFTKDESGTYYKLKDGTYTVTAPTDETNDKYESTTTKYKKETKTETITKSDSVNVEATVGDDGKLTFTGLGAGTYTITETVTPPGYNTIAPFKVTITWAGAETGDGCTWTYSGTDYEDTNKNGKHDEGEPYLAQVTVINKAGSILPETGGMGTTLFYVLGGLLVAAAVVLLVTKRRMNAAE